MTVFIFTFIFFLAIVAAMAIGVMGGRAPISGTCGGMNNLGLDGSCEICGGNPEKCDEQDLVKQPAVVISKTRFYDAS